MCADLLATGLYMYGQSRPPMLRECWEWPPRELDKPAEHMSRMLNRLPVKYLNMVTAFADPFGFVVGMYAVITESQRREQVAFAKFLERNPQARAAYEREQAAKRGTAQPSEDGTAFMGKNGAGVDETATASPGPFVGLPTDGGETGFPA